MDSDWDFDAASCYPAPSITGGLLGKKGNAVIAERSLQQLMRAIKPREIMGESEVSLNVCCLQSTVQRDSSLMCCIVAAP